MSAIGDRLGKSKNLDYPVGIGMAGTGITGQPYMLLTSYESKNAIESQGKIISSIALYIPPNGLRTAFDANWDGLEGAAMRATMGGALSRLNFGAFDLSKTAADRDWDAGNISASLFAGFQSAGTAALGKMSSAIDKGTGMLAAQGIAVNNHMALVYKGPGQFRTHDFAFNFFPKAKQDSEEIKKILQDLKDGMLPKMSGTSLKNARTLSRPYFHSPRHWDIEFFDGTNKTRNTFLFEIKRSVITSMTVNHDPNSTVSLHSDGSPVQTAFSLTFQEIELPISGDTLSERAQEQKDALAQSQQDRPSPTGTAYPGAPKGLVSPINPEGKTLEQRGGFTIPGLR